jgi:23S rRNA pseudouridine1911/1915/1917 synthase
MPTGRSRPSRRPPPRPKRVERDLSVPLERLSWKVGHDEAGGRLDHFLCARLPWRSRNEVHGLIRGGLVTRNGEPLRRKAGHMVLGDAIVLHIPPPTEEAQHEALGRRLADLVIFEDDDVLALAKPAGLVVHPVGRTRVNTLIQGLHWLYRHGPRRTAFLPRICHRLDRDTSGVIVLAKSSHARVRLQEIFETRDVEKSYEAVVAGLVGPDEGLIDLPIGPDVDAEIHLMMTTREDGLPSRTRYAVLERLRGTSLLATHMRFDIETGRQHQIRVHARAIGHPVLLDPLYADGRPRWPDESPVIERQALHARRTVLPHPRTGERLVLEAPLPDDLRALIAGLR